MFQGILGGLGDAFEMMKYFLYASPLIVVLVIGIVHMRNKKTYVHPVRILRQRENGKVKEINRKGGFVNRKGGTSLFRIKTGFWWWKVKDLTETPKLEYMDEDNRVYYKQIDVDTFIQMKREIVEEVEHFNETTQTMQKLKLIPVETDVKYGAILSIHRIKEVLAPKDKWKTIAAIGGMVLVFAMGIVGWALLMNAKCPTVG